MVTIQEIIDAIEAGTTAEKIALAEKVEVSEGFLQAQRQQQADADRQANIDTATAWWTSTALPTLINPITTRDDALQNYNSIKNGIESQTDKWRIYILGEKLKEAEANFIEAKKGNLPITVV